MKARVKLRKSEKIWAIESMKNSSLIPSKTKINVKLIVLSFDFSVSFYRFQ